MNHCPGLLLLALLPVAACGGPTFDATRFAGTWKGDLTEPRSGARLPITAKVTPVGNDLKVGQLLLMPSASPLPKHPPMLNLAFPARLEDRTTEVHAPPASSTARFPFCTSSHCRAHQTWSVPAGLIWNLRSTVIPRSTLAAASTERGSQTV
ncbi:MAG: hypothetical protein H6835_08585 [Planctomycetes bacterium]|nr:hypothetical protein [Planctomycetota bacterium]